ncbi:NUMOD3 domain-containing DNA-binding protein [Chromatium okenii]|jgi:group I intron endonuclease|uniref:NUMOD3 domain-containing DNA-binding protein n=1 Tax=Chromatium okenii TaxID=61644 RepID=UPI0026F31A8B|nr:NUMOD3 domain-containing DNA-binding protein [Chromatium okenii]MBV5310899.1 GIY-YIG nuclease family protein [Chromatium okenii]
MPLPTAYQDYIALSRYSRFQDDLGRREDWSETVNRLLDFWEKRFPEQVRPIRDRLYHAIHDLDVMPSMRSLMTAGEALERDSIACFNCSAVAVKGFGTPIKVTSDELTEAGFDEGFTIHPRQPLAFDNIMYILMCFHPDTLVACETGPKRIADIVPNDKVQSYNENTGCFEWHTVTNTVVTPSADRPKVRVALENGKTFDCTTDHKWLTTNRGWVEAQDLTIDDELVSPTATVYKHTCTITGKSYVGYTGKSVENRWRQHVTSSANQSARDYDTHFHRAIRKYGTDCWGTEILEWVASELAAQQAECKWIEQLEPQYNMTKGGEGTIGLKWSEESRIRASENAYERTPEHRKAQADRLELCREKINATRNTPEYKQAQAERNRGELNPMYGKKMTEEQLELRREMFSGEKNPFFGRQHSEETKAVLSEKARAMWSERPNPFKGRCHSEETRQKMRATKAANRAAREAV